MAGTAKMIFKIVRSSPHSTSAANSGSASVSGSPVGVDEHAPSGAQKYPKPDI